MKPLKQENVKDLTEKVLDLVAKTSVEIGHKTDPQTMATLSKIFAQDLIKENRFGNMTFNQIQDAFHSLYFLYNFLISSKHVAIQEPQFVEGL